MDEFYRHISQDPQEENDLDSGDDEIAWSEELAHLKPQLLHSDYDSGTDTDGEVETYKEVVPSSTLKVSPRIQLFSKDRYFGLRQSWGFTPKEDEFSFDKLIKLLEEKSNDSSFHAQDSMDRKNTNIPISLRELLHRLKNDSNESKQGNESKSLLVDTFISPSSAQVRKLLKPLQQTFTTVVKGSVIPYGRNCLETTILNLIKKQDVQLITIESINNWNEKIRQPLSILQLGFNSIEHIQTSIFEYIREWLVSVSIEPTSVCILVFLINKSDLQFSTLSYKERDYVIGRHNQFVSKSQLLEWLKEKPVKYSFNRLFKLVARNEDIEDDEYRFKCLLGRLYQHGLTLRDAFGPFLPSYDWTDVLKKREKEKAFQATIAKVNGIPDMRFQNVQESLSHVPVWFEEEMNKRNTEHILIHDVVVNGYTRVYMDMCDYRFVVYKKDGFLYWSVLCMYSYNEWCEGLMHQYQYNFCHPLALLHAKSSVLGDWQNSRQVGGIIYDNVLTRALCQTLACSIHFTPRAFFTSGKFRLCNLRHLQLLSIPHRHFSTLSTNSTICPTDLLNTLPNTSLHKQDCSMMSYFSADSDWYEPWIEAPKLLSKPRSKSATKIQPPLADSFQYPSLDDVQDSYLYQLEHAREFHHPFIYTNARVVHNDTTKYRVDAAIRLKRGLTLEWSIRCDRPCKGIHDEQHPLWMHILGSENKRSCLDPSQLFRGGDFIQRTTCTELLLNWLTKPNKDLIIAINTDLGVGVGADSNVNGHERYKSFIINIYRQSIVDHLQMLWL